MYLHLRCYIFFFFFGLMPLQNQKNIIVKHLIEMKFVASREDRGIVAIVQHLFTGSSSKRFLKTILAQRDDLSPSSKTTQKPTKIHEIWQNDHKTTCGSDSVRYAPGFTLYLKPPFSRVPFHYSRVVNRANAVLTWLLTALTKCLLWVNSWAILAKLAIRHIFIDKVGNSLHIYCRSGHFIAYLLSKLAIHYLLAKVVIRRIYYR